MEEAIAALLAGLLELLVEAFGELIFELLISGLYRAAIRIWGRRMVNILSTNVVLLLMGALCGAVSVWLVPHPVVHPSRAYGVSVLVSPLLVGLAMWQVGRLFRTRGKDATPLENFWNGAAFAFAMALVRLLMVR